MFVLITVISPVGCNQSVVNAVGFRIDNEAVTSSSVYSTHPSCRTFHARKFYEAQTNHVWCKGMAPEPVL